jgi:hypothetical protein
MKLRMNIDDPCFPMLNNSGDQKGLTVLAYIALHAPKGEQTIEDRLDWAEEFIREHNKRTCPY